MSIHIKSILMISSPSEEALIKAITKFYGGAPPITLQGDTWPKQVCNAHGPIDGFEAHRARSSGRYRYQLRARRQ